MRRRRELADGGQCLALRQLTQRAAQALGHRVERASHPTHLIAGLFLDLTIQITQRDRLRRSRQSNQSARRAPRQQRRETDHRKRDDPQDVEVAARRLLERLRERRKWSGQHQVHGRLVKLVPDGQPGLVAPDERLTREQSRIDGQREQRGPGGRIEHSENRAAHTAPASSAGEEAAHSYTGFQGAQPPAGRIVIHPLSGL